MEEMDPEHVEYPEESKLVDQSTIEQSSPSAVTWRCERKSNSNHMLKDDRKHSELFEWLSPVNRTFVGKLYIS